MDTGMLWYDDTKRDLNSKLARAVEHYKTKYSDTPTLCFVNPAMLGKDVPDTAAGLALRPSRTVLPNHFWIGVGEVKTKSKSKQSNQ